MSKGFSKFFGALFGISEPEVAAPSGPRHEPALRGGKTPPPMTPARQRLIQSALAVTAAKQHILDEMDPAAREKLVREAFEKLGPTAGLNGRPKGKQA
jgi:hypothetical protein